MANAGLFVLRRAWRLGEVNRKDVARAFGTEKSSATTARLMKEAVASWPNHVYWRKKKGILPTLGAQCPPEASARRVLDLLAHGASPQETGIFEDDGVPLLRPEPLSSGTMTEAATTAVLDAVLKNHPMEILYVGLRRGEMARWRRVWPSAVEHTGMYWRLRAQDIDAEGNPIKTFVLSRILEARLLRNKDIRAGFKRQMVVRTDALLRVHFNENLTSDQQAALRHGFGVRADNTMRWPEHALYELKRTWSDSPPQSGVVWPVFTRIDEVE